MSALDSDQPGSVPRHELLDGNVFATEGREEELQSAIEDVRGSPTWPIPVPGHEAGPPILPIGLNWAVVAEHLEVERRILEHEGSIVLPGEYFPESGFFLDPVSLRGRHVDVGDVALRPVYFLGDLSVSEFRISIQLEQTSPASGQPIVPTSRGTIVSIFADEATAMRAKRRLLHGSLATGISTKKREGGVEMRIEHPELEGRVASVVAGYGGAVISIGGRSLTAYSGPLSTDSSLTGGRGFTGEMGDASRPGTGVSGGSEGVEVSNRGTEIVDGKEFRAR
ncbi:MAG: hypothetical protein ACRDFS_11860 [Chloroflexota bacterium]